MKASKFPFKDLFKSLHAGFLTRADLAFEMTEKYGGVVRFPVPFKEIYFIADPDAIKRVMVDNSKNYVKTPDYRNLAEFLGEGLLTKNDEEWIKDRKLIQPLFTGKKLTAFVSVIRSETSSFFDSMKLHQDIDMDKAFSKLALKIIGKWALDLDINKYDDDIAKILAIGQERVSEKGWSLMNISSFYRTREEKVYQDALLKLKKITKELMRIADAQKSDTQNLYTLLKEAQKSEEEIIDHLITFFLAGHETMAVALGWTSHLLSIYPEIQSKLRDSLSEVKKDTPSMETPPYLLQVIEESMRLYPPISFVSRMAKREDVIGGIRIKKGAILAICPWATHRSAKYWNEPLKMIPERFSAENKSSMRQGVYYPFGLGPRRCIAMHFSMFEMNVIISELVTRFTIHPSDKIKDLRALPYISTRPNQPLYMRLEPVKNE